MAVIAMVKETFRHQSGIHLPGTSRHRGKERYAASHFIDLAMADVFHYRPAHRWCYLPDSAAHADWLVTSGDLGRICAEPVQD